MDENIIEFKDEYGTNCDSLEQIEKFLSRAIEEDKKIISFDDVEFRVDNFSFNNILIEVFEVLFDKSEHVNRMSKLSFSFDNAIFKTYPSFNYLICNELSFYHTTFKEGIKLYGINANKVICKPKELTNDIDFYGDEDDYKSKITNFIYKHPLKCNGFTLVTGVNIENGNFMDDCVLDHLHFKNMNLENCYFLGSKIDKTLFNNCIFKSHKNLLFVSTFNIKHPFNKHFGIKDEANTFKHYQKYKNKNQLETLLRQCREIYRQLKLNFENAGDFQTSGDFHYSQRLLESFIGIKYPQVTFNQKILYKIHNFINNFGTSWLKPLVWFLLAIFIFSFFTTPNEDYISTESTPPFLLNAYNKKNNSLEFDFNNIQNDYNFFYDKDKAHFIEIAKTNYKDINKTTIYAYDNRFDFKFNEQYIPMLKNDFTTQLYYSFSNIVAPFTPDNKKWFTNRTSKAVKLSILETILLWFFFGAFVLAIKNRIRR